MTALRLFLQLAQEEARLCGAVFPAAEQAGVLSQVPGAVLRATGSPFVSAAIRCKPGFKSAETNYSFNLGMRQRPACNQILALRWPALHAWPLPQVLSGGAASLFSCSDFVLSCRRMPDKLCGLLEMHAAVEGALPSLRASLAAVGGDATLPLLGQLSQVGRRQGLGLHGHASTCLLLERGGSRARGNAVLACPFPHLRMQ